MLPLHSKNQLVLTEESHHFEGSRCRQPHAMDPKQEYVPRPGSRVDNLRDIIPPPLSMAFFRLEQLL